MPLTPEDFTVGTQLKNRLGTLFTITERTEDSITCEFIAPVGGETKVATYSLDWARFQFQKVE